jgi:hypothetical protein
MQDSPLQPDSRATRWQTSLSVVLVSGLLCCGIYLALHASFKRSPPSELTPTLPIDDASPSVWTGAAADGFLEKRVTLIGTFADRGKGQETFAAMKSRLPAEAKAVLVGQTLLVALPSESAFAGSCERELKASCQDVCVDDGTTNSVWVFDCTAPDEAAAERIAQEADAYVTLSSPTAPLIAPWSTTPAPTAEQRKARRTYSKIIAAQSRPPSHRAGGSQPGQSAKQRPAGRTASRQPKGRRPSAGLVAAARAIAEVRLEGPDAVDLEVVDAYAVSISVPPSANWPKGAGPTEARERMKQRMGLLAAENRKSMRVPDDLGAPMGAIGRTNLVVHLSGFTFAHIEDGLPALIDWLHAQHCKSIKYQVLAGIRPRTQGEIDQREAQGD